MEKKQQQFSSIVLPASFTNCKRKPVLKMKIKEVAFLINTIQQQLEFKNERTVTNQNAISQQARSAEITLIQQVNCEIKTS